MPWQGACLCPVRPVSLTHCGTTRPPDANRLPPCTPTCSCTASQVAFQGCLDCPCAATSTCTAAQLGTEPLCARWAGAGLRPRAVAQPHILPTAPAADTAAAMRPVFPPPAPRSCEAYPREVCDPALKQANLFVLAFTGLAAVVFLALPACLTLLILCRLEASSAVAGARAGHAACERWRPCNLPSRSRHACAAAASRHFSCSRQAPDGVLCRGPADVPGGGGREALGHTWGGWRAGQGRVREGCTQSLAAGWQAGHRCSSLSPADPPAVLQMLATWVAFLLDTDEPDCRAIGDKVLLCRCSRVIVAAAQAVAPVPVAHSFCTRASPARSAAVRWRRAASTCRYRRRPQGNRPRTWAGRQARRAL